MNTISQTDYTNSFFQLLKDTFEGPPNTGSSYLDKEGGLFQTLERLSAEAASFSSGDNAPTIAGHCEHVRFYVMVLYDYLRGTQAKVDWKESWLVRTVTPAEWETLKESLRRAYETVTEHLQAVERWGEEEVGDGMAILVHTAYHLGAIRQLARSHTPLKGVMS